MKNVPMVYDGVIHHVYYANRGDSLRRHRHGVNHLCFVVQGRIEAEIFDDKTGTLDIGPDGFGIDLPARIDHEIRVLEDNTIFINLYPKNVAERAPRKPYNRVKMADGSYVSGPV